jgi:hypothetical protein
VTTPHAFEPIPAHVNVCKCGSGPGGPIHPEPTDWRLAFSALAQLVRDEYGGGDLAETARIFVDGIDEKSVEAVRAAQAYWTARGAKWTKP